MQRPWPSRDTRRVLSLLLLIALGLLALGCLAVSALLYADQDVDLGEVAEMRDAAHHALQVGLAASAAALVSVVLGIVWTSRAPRAGELRPA